MAKEFQGRRRVLQIPDDVNKDIPEFHVSARASGFVENVQYRRKPAVSDLQPSSLNHCHGILLEL